MLDLSSLKLDSSVSQYDKSKKIYTINLVLKKIIKELKFTSICHTS